MNRPKRNIVRPKRYDDSIDEPIIKPKRQPKQQPKQQAQTAIPALPVPAIPVPDSAIPVPAIPVPDSRTLDLGHLPPSNNPKFKAHFDEITNEFWRNNFYTPDDDITKIYFELMPKFEGLLPASFEDGIANLELKQELIEPIKQIPLYSKLLNGEYEIATSKSDKNIATVIKFIVNNLPSFQQYKNTDDLSFIIHNHRLIVLEILYYSFVNGSRLATIKSKFNAITRIFRIAYKTKNYYLYEKYSALVIFLGSQFESDEFNNELSQYERKKYIDWTNVLWRQKQLENIFNSLPDKKTKIAYELNNDLLLLSLYCLRAPLRLEVMSLQFTTKSETKGDYIYFTRDDEIILDLNEEKKRHEGIQFNLSQEAPQLAQIIKQSYELYPRKYVFTKKNLYPNLNEKATVMTLQNRLKALFRNTGQNVSVNSLRSSYVSYVFNESVSKGKLISVNQQEKIANQMRTSRKYLTDSYLKIFQQDKNVEIKQEPQAEQEPIDNKSSYERQKERSLSYYYKNKEIIKAKMREYSKNKGSFKNSKDRLLRFLNSDKNYRKNIKQSTLDKYNFKLNQDGRYE